MHRAFLVLVAAGSACAAALACSAVEPPPNTGDVGGGAATVVSSTSASSSAGDGGGGTFASSGSGGIGGGCAGIVSKAEPIPLDIFVMLDQSGSMLEDAGNLLSRWQTVKQALTTFVQSPSAAGIGIGLQYFGLPQPLVPGCYAIACATDADCVGGCGLCHPAGVCQAPYNPDVDSCDGSDYAWADVPIQELPGAANPIIASLAMHSPGTNTPTMPALQGALEYTKAWKLAHPDRVVVVVFATDGDPAVCDTSLDNINAVAAAAYAEAPSVPTYVIGVGPSLSALDGIAAAGGTGAAFHVDFDMTAQEQLLDAMNTIRAAALPCVYQIPPAPPGQEQDFTLVNVAYVPGGGGPEQTIPKVEDQASCPVNGDGWYYDDNAAPTQIVLCEATCEEIADDMMAEVDIVLGCQTILR